jgi:hypothetical protein
LLSHAAGKGVRFRPILVYPAASDSNARFGGLAGFCEIWLLNSALLLALTAMHDIPRLLSVTDQLRMQYPQFLNR